MELLAEIGRGSSSTIYAITLNNQLCCLKIPSPAIKEKKLCFFQRELEVLRMLSPHPGIVKLYDVL
jgi:serine/threonine protein kinase